MKINDFLNPSYLKIIEQQQNLIKNVVEMNKNSYALAMNNNAYITAINNMKYIPNSHITALDNIKIDKILKTIPIQKNVVNDFSKYDFSKNILNDSFNFQESLDFISKNNAILANSINQTIKLTINNNYCLNNKEFQNIANIFSSLDLNVSKNALKEFSYYLKIYTDRIEKNYNITAKSSEKEVNQSENDDKFDDVFDKINDKSTPFTENDINEILSKLFNIYIYSIGKVKKVTAFSTTSIAGDILPKSINENIFKSDFKELIVLLISIITFAVSSWILKNNSKHK